ncbi:hypothetical protein [Actinomadura harenae]|uniref:Uncharacterized protein n=1 Tax=Actinomadura harenae TaxID=2483351 RepID=A0A3M2MJM6_9ACTN|nr:hypothetical protein [Actinomadura harenae]RMI47578.1 hypothetical protein EBO15_01365 [Actinomadura harenae]
MTRRQDVVRAALAAYAVRVQPRAALSLIRTRITTKNTTAAPDWDRGGGTATDCKESPAMTSIPVHARHLLTGQHIVQHPDHPDRAVNYTVVGLPRLQTTALMEVDYCTADGSEGRLVLDPIAPVQVEEDARDAQRLAARAVLELTSGIYRHLPTIWAWKIREGGLKAQLDSNDATTIPDLRQWANALGAPITWSAYDHLPSSAHVEATGTVLGVTVEIWGAVATALAESELAESETTR